MATVVTVATVFGTLDLLQTFPSHGAVGQMSIESGCQAWGGVVQMIPVLGTDGTCLGATAPAFGDISSEASV